MLLLLLLLLLLFAWLFICLSGCVTFLLTLFTHDLLFSQAELVLSNEDKVSGEA